MIKLLVLLSLLTSTAFASSYPPTTSKDSTDTINVTTFNFQFPNFTGTHTNTTFSLGVNSVAGGGTGNTSYTAGSVLFSNGSIITQNNAQFFWDNTNDRLGIGTNAPNTYFQVAESLAGGVTANITNSLASSSNSASWTITNDAGSTGAFTLFSSTFVATYLDNATRLAGSNSLWLVSDVNGANGGADPIIFSPTGYNNEVMRVNATGLGIKNTNPSYTLDVTGTMRATTSITDGGITGTNAGAPLSVNSGGTLVAGITYSEATLTTATAIGTTATSVMSITPAAGTYHVDAGVNISAASAAGNILTCGIYYNGAYNASSYRSAEPQETGFGGAFQNMNISTQGNVTANGTASIGLECISSAGTVTVNYGTLDIMRLQ